MAGIYIHIPFCKQACSYCNFHFSTSAKNKEQLLLAIQQEIIGRASYLKDERIDSLYFGGGTPSILSIEELQSLFTSLDQNFDLSHLREVTLEANPDDLKPKQLAEYRSMGINRLSVGIQSFHQKDLDFMRRAHSAKAGLESIRQAKAAGFDKISLDLIFGIPGSNLELWRENLHQFFELDISHLSSYALTLEEGTIYHHQSR